MSTVTPQVVKYVIFLGWDGGYIREEYSGEGIIFPNGTILPPNHVKRECGNRIQINRYAGGLTVKTRLYFEIMDFLANNDLGVDIDVQLINHLNRVLELVKHHSIVANQAYTDIMINNFISKLFSTIITKYHSIEAFSQKSNKTRMALNSIIERFIDYESIYTNEEVKKYLRQNSSAKNKALLIKLGDVADLIEEYKQAGDVDALLHLLQQQKVSSEDKNNIISHYISLVNNGQPNGTASAQSNLLSSKILLAAKTSNLSFGNDLLPFE